MGNAKFAEMEQRSPPAPEMMHMSGELKDPGGSSRSLRGKLVAR